MPKVNLVVGQPCPVCGTPAVPGKNGAYCKACYIKWKNEQEGMKPTQGGYAPQNAVLSPTGQPGSVLPDRNANELRIVKQAILKSAIEGGVITKEFEEKDEAFLNRWIEWVYRNTELDRKLTETKTPF